MILKFFPRVYIQFCSLIQIIEWVLQLFFLWCTFPLNYELIIHYGNIYVIKIYLFIFHWNIPSCNIKLHLSMFCFWFVMRIWKSCHYFLDSFRKVLQFVNKQEYYAFADTYMDLRIHWQKRFLLILCKIIINLIFFLSHQSWAGSFK